MFEELLIVREDDQLPVGEPVGEQLGEPPAMLDVEAVDHVVEIRNPSFSLKLAAMARNRANRERVPDATRSARRAEGAAVTRRN